MLTENHLMRQLDLVPMEILDEPITCIGAGAVGGWTVLGLAKMGFHDITVWDFDEVNDENMNSQFYRLSDIGSTKVKALASLVRDFTGVEIKIREEKYERGLFRGIVISAVDSMAVRKTIWDNHAKKAIGTKFIVDPRMAAEAASLYVMDPLSPVDCEQYAHTLFTDEQGLQERCTAKATIYTAFLLGGLVCKSVRDALSTSAYLRTAVWDIKRNAFQGWCANGGK